MKDRERLFNKLVLMLTVYVTHINLCRYLFYRIKYFIFNLKNICLQITTLLLYVYIQIDPMYLLPTYKYHTEFNLQKCRSKKNLEALSKYAGALILFRASSEIEVGARV